MRSSKFEAVMSLNKILQRLSVIGSTNDVILEVRSYFTATWEYGFGLFLREICTVADLT